MNTPNRTRPSSSGKPSIISVIRSSSAINFTTMRAPELEDSTLRMSPGTEVSCLPSLGLRAPRAACHQCPTWCECSVGNQTLPDSGQGASYQRANKHPQVTVSARKRSPLKCWYVPRRAPIRTWNDRRLDDRPRVRTYNAELDPSRACYPDVRVAARHSLRSDGPDSQNGYFHRARQGSSRLDCASCGESLPGAWSCGTALVLFHRLPRPCQRRLAGR